MRRILFILLFILIGITDSLAQNRTVSTRSEVCKRLEMIAHRDSTTSNIRKESILIDTLNSQIEDYRYLQKSYEALIKQKSDSIVMLNIEYNKLKLLLSDSIDVFTDTTIVSIEYPLCLEKRMVIISKVIEAEKLLGKIEVTVNSLQEKYAALDDTDRIKYINREIESDTDGLYNLLNDILNLDLSVFSDEQRAYIKPGLTERYNKLQKYFE